MGSVQRIVGSGHTWWGLVLVGSMNWNNAVTDQEKREKKIVVKKLAEMEEELKLLALSENLTDQTLDQLKSDNNRLRSENTALLRVIAKMSK
jgi:hypothetical protein